MSVGMSVERQRALARNRGRAKEGRSSPLSCFLSFLVGRAFLVFSLLFEE